MPKQQLFADFVALQFIFIYTNKEGGMISHPALVLLDSLAIFLGNALPISLMSFIPLKRDY